MPYNHQVAQNGPNKKVANSLLALSSAAVLAVYAAGYQRTRPAADRLLALTSERRPVRPSSAVVAAQVVEPPPDVPRPLTPAPVPSSVPAEPQPKIAAARKEPPPSQAVTALAPATTPTPVSAPVEIPPPAAIATPEPPPAPPVAAAPPTPAVAVAVAVAPAAAPAPPAAPAWKDGTYLGWGHCRHGDIEASVVIQGGRIVSATISQCLTRYDCDVIDKLPPQVPARQNADVDSVSGATQSGDAFYYAVTDALSKAK